MTWKLFVSYRRSDNAELTYRICDHLMFRFGKENVFVDYTIPSFALWTQHLEKEIDDCDVLVAVIGPNWSDLLKNDPKAQQSTNNQSTDWVVEEITRAIRQSKLVFTILVGDAKMPGKSELPDSIKRLASLQAARLHQAPESEFFSRCQQIVADIERKLLQQNPPDPAGFTGLKTLDVHGNQVKRIAWSPDGQYLAAASIDQQLLLYEMRDPRWTCHYLRHHAPVYSVAWSPDSSQIVTGSYTPVGSHVAIEVWQSRTRQQSGSLGKTNGHTQTITALAWSTTSNLLASGSDDRRILFWDVQGQQLLQELSNAGDKIGTTAHDGHVNSLVWSPHGLSLVSCSDDRSIKRWDLDIDKHCIYVSELEAKSYKRGPGPQIKCVAWHPVKDLITYCCDDGTIRAWDFERGEGVIFPRHPEGHERQVTWIDFAKGSLDGEANGHRLLASKSHDNTVRLWDFDTMRPVTAPLLEDHSNRTNSSLCFHPSDPTKLATLGRRERVVRVWELEYGEFNFDPTTPDILDSIDDMPTPDEYEQSVAPVKDMSRFERLTPIPMTKEMRDFLYRNVPGIVDRD